MIVLGVTGSLSSGKTEVSKILKENGAHVLDADVMAKNAVRPGTPAYRAIIQIFGREYVGKDKQIDRRKLAARVFSNPAELNKLNILIHPGVIFEALSEIEKRKNQTGFIVLDVPLLFESKMESLADYKILVRAKKSRILDRSKQKGISKDLAEKILKSQWPDSKKAKLCDYVIDNQGSVKELEKKVLEVLEDIKRQA